MKQARKPFFRSVLGVLLMMFSPAPPARADEHPEEKALRERLRSFFAAGDAKERQTLVAAMLQDPAYDKARISELLHSAALWPPRKSGRSELEVEVGLGQVRRVTLRLPKGYDPAQKWPLILAYHSGGANGPSILRHVEELLGPQVERFVLAAPTNYRQTSLDAPPPYTPEHPVLVRELRKQVHVDSDRVFAFGYSLGGYTAWTLAILHPDLLAGAMPMASTISIPGDLEGGWQQVGRNFAHLPILHVWGQADNLNVPGFEARDQFAGTMASFNQEFTPNILKLGFDTVTDQPIPRAGHGGATPDPALMKKLLENQRARWPRKVQHQFRHLHQGSAYWLEANEWQGEGWFDSGRRIERQKGETWPQAYGRVFLPLLGELKGEVAGQKIRIETRHVADLTVWLSPELIDLTQPIEIELAGKKVFAGKVEPDLGVLLEQARTTRDFERLRWAGVRIDAQGQAKIVEAGTVFPPLIRKN